MAPSLRIMKCQRRDKPAGARTMQKELHGIDRMEPDLEKWVIFLFWRRWRKKYLAKVHKIVSSIHADAKPKFCSLINLSSVLCYNWYFLKNFLNQ